jgi:hypothetical protein
LRRAVLLTILDFKPHMYSQRSEHRTSEREILNKCHFSLITGPKSIMLLIILLGVITKLAVVSAHCHVGNIGRNKHPLSYSDRTNVSYSVTTHNVLNVIFMCKQNRLAANESRHIIVYRYLVLAVPYPAPETIRKRGLYCVQFWGHHWKFGKNNNLRVSQQVSQLKESILFVCIGVIT